MRGTIEPHFVTQGGDLLIRPPRFMADPMPIDRATGTATRAVRAASSRLLGSRVEMTWETGMLATSDWPGSPLTMPPSQER
jgi:hypothetical protein